MTEHEANTASAEESRMSLAERVARFKEREWVRRAMLALPSWITPNGVTVFRTVLMIPVTVLLFSGLPLWALLLFNFAMSLDFVDGALAEARGLKTEWGAFADPLADKLSVLIPLGALAHLMILGWWLFGINLLTGVALTFTRGRKMLRRDKMDTDGQADIKARPVGKIKLITEVISLTIVMLGLTIESLVLVWIGSGLMLVAAVLGLLSLRSHLVGEG